MDSEMNARRESAYAKARAIIAEIAKDLKPTEREALLLLREDGRGNYDPRLTKARRALEQKQLADSPMDFGFGRNPRIATHQKPTKLGLAVAKLLREEAV